MDWIVISNDKILYRDPWGIDKYPLETDNPPFTEEGCNKNFS